MEMELSRFELEKVVLEVIQRTPDVALFASNHKRTLTHQVRQHLPEDQSPSSGRVAELFWSLLSQGLIYIDFSNPDLVNWRSYTTKRGDAVLEDNSTNPDDVCNYIKNIREISDNDLSVVMYVQEALTAYRAQCYLSTTVMLGVASESAFYKLGDSFLNWLEQGKEYDNFSKVLRNRKYKYVHKFREFRKRLVAHLDDVDKELTDHLTLTLDAVLEYLRINRNEAGHPSGKTMKRKDTRVMLEIFPYYLEKLFKLNEWFVENRNASSKTDKTVST